VYQVEVYSRTSPIQNASKRNSWGTLGTVIIRVFITTAFVFLPTARGFARSPVDKAWTILKSSLADKNNDTRALATRVLGLLTNDSQAEEFAVKALGDPEAEVRAAAAAALSQMNAKSAALQLREALKNETDISVIIAGAHSLITLGDPSGYSIYYAVLTGETKTGGALLEDQMKMLHDPKKMAKFGFEQGIGFVPFASYGYSAFQVLSKKKGSSPIQAAAAKMLAEDPDPRSGAALVEATSDKSELVRAAALDSLARRNDPAVLVKIAPKLNDKSAAVRLTAAAAIIHLQSVK
jgi:HEAT repeat protein